MHAFCIFSVIRSGLSYSRTISIYSNGEKFPVGRNWSEWRERIIERESLFTYSLQVLRESLVSSKITRIRSIFHFQLRRCLMLH